MWFPVEVHSVGAVAGGLLDAAREHLRQCPQFHLVSDRRFDGRRISDADVDSVIDALDDCSVSFSGTTNMRAIGPFGGFTLAPDLGVAYLEHLVAHDPLPNDRELSVWITAPVNRFVTFLLRDNPEIDTVVLPMPLGDLPFDGFTQATVDDRFHLTRS